MSIKHRRISVFTALTGSLLRHKTMWTIVKNWVYKYVRYVLIITTIRLTTEQDRRTPRCHVLFVENIRQMLQQTQETKTIQTLSMTLRQGKIQKEASTTCAARHTLVVRERNRTLLVKLEIKLKVHARNCYIALKILQLSYFSCLTAKTDCDHPTRLDLWTVRLLEARHCI